MSHLTRPGEEQWHEIKACLYISLDVLLTEEKNLKNNPLGCKNT